jgi:hypothetical protein
LENNVTSIPTRRFAAMLGGLAILAACAEGTDPTAPQLSTPARVDLAPTAIGEGELWICKAGNASGTFSFAYSMVSDAGAAGPSGTVSVDAGTCVMAAAVDKVVTGPTNRWFATVTETALPAYWSLTGITVTYTGSFTNTPVIDLPNRTVSRIRIANDLGGTATFTNAYVPPTGQIGNFVWEDLNGNGVQDSGEPGIAGVLVTLSGDANASMLTDANGNYLFSGLPAGSYSVTVAGVPGYAGSPSNQGGDPALDSNGSPSAVTLATDSSIDLTIDFGFVKRQGPACTLTQGYWKTHGEDWDEVGEKLFTTTDLFYNSGQGYLAIMNTAPKGGNAYLQLAHQFIAASLNTNGGPSGVAAVDAAMAGAAAYFAGAPAGIPTPSGALRTQLQAWATTLDNYNNGLTGPGHCS